MDGILGNESMLSLAPLTLLALYDTKQNSSYFKDGMFRRSMFIDASSTQYVMVPTSTGPFMPAALEHSGPNFQVGDYGAGLIESDLLIPDGRQRSTGEKKWTNSKILWRWIRHNVYVCLGLARPLSVEDPIDHVKEIDQPITEQDAKQLLSCIPPIMCCPSAGGQVTAGDGAGTSPVVSESVPKGEAYRA